MTEGASADIHGLAGAYALDALDANETLAFEHHLLTCAACSTEVIQLREVAAVLADSVAEDPPSDLRSRVLEQARRTPQAPAGSGPPVVDLTAHRSRRSTVNGWLAGIAAAAVLVAGGLGASAYQANQRADDAQVAADQISELLAEPGATVEQSDVSGGGTGTLVVAADRKQAAFLTTSLPATEAGQTYQLWAIDSAGATSVGLLAPKAGRSAELVNLPAGTTAFGMSVEPMGGSEAPTTEPVLLVTLPA
jgi:anti-sigma-K factor RskA